MGDYPRKAGGRRVVSTEFGSRPPVIPLDAPCPSSPLLPPLVREAPFRALPFMPSLLGCRHRSRDGVQRHRVRMGNPGQGSCTVSDRGMPRAARQRPPPMATRVSASRYALNPGAREPSRCTGLEGSSNVGGSEATNRQGGLSSTKRGGRVRGAAKLGEAAEVLARYPIPVQLRYLQTCERSPRSATSPPPSCLRRSRSGLR